MDVIAGSVAEDGDGYVSPNGTATEFSTWVRSLFARSNATVADRVIGAYTAEPPPDGPDRTYSPYYWLGKHLLADAEMFCPARRAARLIAARGAAAFVYRFVHAPPDLPSGSGASHFTVLLPHAS